MVDQLIGEEIIDAGAASPEQFTSAALERTAEAKPFGCEAGVLIEVLHRLLFRVETDDAFSIRHPDHSIIVLQYAFAIVIAKTVFLVVIADLSFRYNAETLERSDVDIAFLIKQE